MRRTAYFEAKRSSTRPRTDERRSWAPHASANVASSDRNPYPGWTASQPVIIAALMTAGWLR